MFGIILFIILIVLIMAVLVLNVKIVAQSYAYVIERLGSYKTTWETGLHIKIPFIEVVAKKVSLKEQVIDFPPQPVITKDNVTMQIDTVVYFQITDPKLYTYGVERPMQAIEVLTATTLRNIIGDMELDETLTSRDIVNTKLRVILDEATDPWGIKVNRVELKNILPPREIQDAMEKQMKAERERRESILRAEGEKKSAILIAEGEKESAILRAEASKQSKIKEAEGNAEAVIKMQEANAEGIRMINEAKAGQEYIALKSLETFSEVSKGKSTKIIIPSEIQNMAGLLSSLKETIIDGDIEENEAKKEK
ncbi:SPFH domain-containing protein [Anaerofustis stercorihominis]|uniref:SPFH domain-containing protein n=1 Tax=Anaerofustis stercorihominis TaxID=214853 RepID=UPI00214C18A5|nr:SPFH domain-containing protein [Anaerofustis stercorihominis]MCR2033793.1 SPFH/Band 7/PHB domain protein [Anaerofustis stercorihominis]